MEGETDLAMQLGVRDEVLVEAIDMRRQGFRLPPNQNELLVLKKRGMAKLRIHVWSCIAPQVLASARRRHETSAAFVRSLLHALLRTTFEPVSRRPGHREQKMSSTWVQPCVTMGLYQAVCRRAAALGVTHTCYVNLWLKDYVSGKLPPVRVRVVARTECFDDAALYVLPVFSDGGANVAKTA